MNGRNSSRVPPRYKEEVKQQPRRQFTLSSCSAIPMVYFFICICSIPYITFALLSPTPPPYHTKIRTSEPGSRSSLLSLPPLPPTETCAPCIFIAKIFHSSLSSLVGSRRTVGAMLPGIVVGDTLTKDRTHQPVATVQVSTPRADHLQIYHLQIDHPQIYHLQMNQL